MMLEWYQLFNRFLIILSENLLQIKLSNMKIENEGRVVCGEEIH